MKKMIALLLAMAMCFALVACGTNTEKPVDEKPAVENTDNTSDPQPQPQPEDTTKPVEGGETTEGGEQNTDDHERAPELEDGRTVGIVLMGEFKEKAATMTAEEMANLLVTNPVIPFAGGVIPVEAGYLTGFNNEISGFKSGYMFAPMIGTIPFVGYIFELDDGADTAAFEATLRDNHNLRWNICTSADEMVMHTVENKVMFVMSPCSFVTEEPTVDETAEGAEGAAGTEGTEGTEGAVTESTETPATETPATETPATETPAESSEAPAAEPTETPAEGAENTATEGETTTNPAA